MKILPEVFREYDVRGVVGEQLHPHLANKLGMAVGTTVRRGGGQRVIVGRDHRNSGEELSQALIEGLAATGCTPLVIGVTPTPVNYWAIEHLKADGGVQITGSHNPPEYNGFKMTLLGSSLHGQDIQNLLKLIEEEDYISGSATPEKYEVIDKYIDELAENLKPASRPLKVVLDAGNGTAGLTCVPLYKRLGYDVVPLFCNLDGNFPNHHPDPTVEKNLDDLRKEISKQKADLGMAFDGDADRIGVIDSNGEVIWGDKLLIILAREVLKQAPGSSIIGEVKCSKTLFDDIKANNGKPVMWRAGHSLIKSKMKEVDAVLAGEMSGHIFFKHRYYGFDDAVYAGGRLLEILSDSNKSIGEHLADIPKTVSTPELRVDCAEKIKFDLVTWVVNHFKERAKLENFKVNDIDGVRAEWPDGWGLVRPSNTQPILVLRFEATSKNRLEQIQHDFNQVIKSAKKEFNA